MSSIVTKFSDYVVQSVEYFIAQIETELAYRDLSGLTNGRVAKIGVVKEHPLSMLMSAQLAEARNADKVRSSLIPVISVTPGSLTSEGFTLGNAYQPEIVDNTFIDYFKELQLLTQKEIQESVLITTDQIDTIVSEYNRTAESGMKSQKNQWNKKEEINISIWSDSVDEDIILGLLMDSVLSFMQIGFMGDDSPIRNMEIKTTKGLTNFNFGRTLYGSEYNLTILNSFNNYIIYTDDVISGHEFNPTFIIPGESE